MATTKLRQQVKQLQAEFATLIVPRQGKREHLRRLEERMLDALERLFALIPESRHKAVGKLVLVRRRLVLFHDAEATYNEVGFDHPAFDSLLILLWRRNLGPYPTAPMTEALADAYLTDPRLKPRLQCQTCSHWLPQCWGFWTHDENPTTWHQGPLTPFPDCPVCGQEKVWDRGHSFTLTAEGAGWRFSETLTPSNV
jgi:hypothetical protein